jgi:colanic acid biosynthesis glycosyl transferase WcaI
MLRTGVITLDLLLRRRSLRTMQMDSVRPTAAVFYHYFPPDDVVSAVHFGELSAGLVENGWDVTAYPTIWGCRDESVRYPKLDKWHDVIIRRLWRPRLRQSSSAGRLLNALWMIARWSLFALHRKFRPDVLIVGTDPILSILVARFWKFWSPRTRIVHWCFDLYPEAAIADGLLPENGLLARVLTHLLRPAYRACSLVVDIGPCMARRLVNYPLGGRLETIEPWALDEPDAPLDPASPERELIFGDARLALLYSGNFGRAHSYKEILDLAELLAPENVRVAFSIRGNCESELRGAVERRGLNIHFAPFASANDLSARLACADVHIVALRPEWTGTVVPSKFFGALSAGRPVLFTGSTDSSIAHWIREYKIGWVLDGVNTPAVASTLLEYAKSRDQQRAMVEHCFEVYRRCFSRKVQILRWDELLRSLLSQSNRSEVRASG